MEQTELSKAIKGAIIALTKLDAVIHELNDEKIHAVNSPEVPVAPHLDIASVTVTDSPVAPIPAVTESVVTTDDLDGEGVPWNADFHTDKKTQVASKEVKGALAWRLKRGVDKEAFTTWRNSLTDVAAPAITPSIDVIDAPVAAPAVPALPAAPAVPALPATPVTSEPTPEVETMKECIIVIKKLIDDYGLSWDDCKEIMVEEFSVAQTGVEVTFGGLKSEQFDQALKYFNDLYSEYETVKSLIAQITEIAGEANAANVQTGTVTIFKAFNTETLDGVYYGDVNKCLQSFVAWLETWKKWAGN